MIQLRNRNIGIIILVMRVFKKQTFKMKTLSKS